MQIPKRVFQLAKQPALSGFSTLAANTLAEADAILSKSVQSGNKTDERPMGGARAALRADGRQLQTRMERYFADYLERAMATMYTDLRASLEDISFDSLALIEDDVVTRQIEIERLVMRLRDADQPSLGRLNLMIAQLHGDGEVRERENPFRPYLLARALHEALRETVHEQATSKVLFDTLSIAMTHCLQGYYGAIEEVFESRGVSSKLTARPSAMTRAQRDRLAWQKAAEQLIGNPVPGERGGHPAQPKQARMLPELQRLMRENQQGAAGTPGAGPSSRLQAPDLQDMVWNVFNQPKAARPPRHPDEAVPFPSLAEGSQAARGGALDAQLRRMQKTGGAAYAPRAPLDLREQIAATPASAPDRLTIDLVTLLFESIVHDEQLPEALRNQLGRLHVPFLRAAMQEPAMLHDAQHPARRLLDRIGTMATGITPDMGCYPALEQRIGQVLDGVLTQFDQDMDVFSDGQRKLDDFVASLLPGSDAMLARCVEVIGEVEVASAMCSGNAAALSKLLAPLDVDLRISNFITDMWVRVLLHPGSGTAADMALLPELVWSAQEITTIEDRTLMVGLLPGMVKHVREGLAKIGMGETVAKAALDQLVMVHMDVLSHRQPAPKIRMDLDQLRAHFAPFAIDRTPARGSDPVSIGRAQLEAALSRRGLAATLYTDSGKPLPRGAGEDWLGMALPGAGFELALDGRYAAARLSAISPRGSLYLFTVSGQAAPSIFVRDALLAAMQAGTLRTVEHAPVFERAVESLMAGAEALAPA